MIQLTIPKNSPATDVILDPLFMQKVLRSLLFVPGNWPGVSRLPPTLRSLGMFGVCAWLSRKHSIRQLVGS